MLGVVTAAYRVVVHAGCDGSCSTTRGEVAVLCILLLFGLDGA